MRLVFLLCLLKMSIFSNESYYTDKVYFDLVTKMEKAFVESIPEERNLTFLGTSGHLTYGIKGLEFEHKGILSMEEMRKLLVSLTNEYLSKINADESLRKYMKEYPFTPKNVILTVYVGDLKKQQIFFPEISVASALESTIHYCCILEGKEYKAKKYIETFEVAEAIVESQK